MRSIVIALSFIVALLMATSQASACVATNNPTHRIGTADFHRVADSTSRVLRDAYDRNTCTILDGEHASGSECVNGAGNSHTTVRVGQTTYHVFNYMVDGSGRVVARGGQYCTTDRENGPIVR